MADLAGIAKENVPKYIDHIKSKGGVSKEEWDWLTHGCGLGFDIKEEDSPDHPIGVIMRADELLLYPKDKETFDKSIFVLVLALAIMSFLPGGVEFCQMRFVGNG